MPITYTVTEYTNEDLEKLKDMDLKTVLEILERIQNGYLPTNWQVPKEDPCHTFSAGEYEATQLHQAMNIAMDAVEKLMKKEEKSKER